MSTLGGCLYTHLELDLTGQCSVVRISSPLLNRGRYTIFPRQKWCVCVWGGSHFPPKVKELLVREYGLWRGELIRKWTACAPSRINRVETKYNALHQLKKTNWCGGDDNNNNTDGRRGWTRTSFGHRWPILFFFFEPRATGSPSPH